MRFLIVNTDYGSFLEWLYGRDPGLGQRSYAEQMAARVGTLFSVADFYSTGLRGLGHEAWEVFANNEPMQKAWAREHGVRTGKPDWPARLARRIANWLRPFDGQPGWVYDILAAQIEHYRPDVLLNQAMDGLSPRFMEEVKGRVRLLVGQHAAALPADARFGCYDLVLSSLPNLVEYFRGAGARSELHRLAFEPRVLSALEKTGNGAAPEVPVSFVGSLSKEHGGRVELLEALCAATPIEVWGGEGAAGLPPASAIRPRHRGPSWGADMYRLLRRSKLTVNHHIGIAGPFANNLRLFEATGVGTMLLTDAKSNLAEMFEPGREVAAYRGPQECAEMIRHYLEHDAERRAMAAAGQARTLRDHTYAVRMAELAGIVARCL